MVGGRLPHTPRADGVPRSTSPGPIGRQHDGAERARARNYASRARFAVTVGGNVFRMSRIRRGGFIFITSIADHAPRHVHVYRGRRLVVKWDLDNDQPMVGSATKAIRKHIVALRKEGRV